MTSFTKPFAVTAPFARTVAVAALFLMAFPASALSVYDFERESRNQQTDYVFKAVDKIAKQDPRETHKFRNHIVCVSIGLSITILVTFLPVGMTHFAIAFTGVPSLIQEILDWVHDL